MKSIFNQLSEAWGRRRHDGDAVRVFHGHGEGEGELQNITIDLFGDSLGGSSGGHFWITWRGEVVASILSEIKNFLESKGALSAVVQEKRGRIERGLSTNQNGNEMTTSQSGNELATSQSGSDVAGLPIPLLGEPPKSFECLENGLRFQIRFQETRHPGLFLDHRPLREWLKKNSLGCSVLNTFCYTGSLSVAARAGGAASITNLDLSRPSVDWSRTNLALNSDDADKQDYISGDVFEWLPRFQKKNRVFDCVIVDPPSSSRAKTGHFSTRKDLSRLVALAMNLVAPNGHLIVSINSQNISWEQFLASLDEAKRSFEFLEVERLGLPTQTFPTRRPDQNYLKGLILKRSE